MVALAAAAAVTERVTPLDDGAQQRAAPSGRAGRPRQPCSSRSRAAASRSGWARATPRTSTTPSACPCPRSLSASTASRKPSPSSEPCCAGHGHDATASLPPVRASGVAATDTRRCRSSWAAGAIGCSSSRRAMPTSLGLTGFSARGVGTTPHPLQRRGSRPAPEHVRAHGGRSRRPPPLQALVQQVTISDDREAAGAALVAQWAEGGAAISVDEVLESPVPPPRVTERDRRPAPRAAPRDGASRPGRPSAGAPTTRRSRQWRRSPRSWRRCHRADLASWADVALRRPVWLELAPGSRRSASTRCSCRSVPTCPTSPDTRPCPSSGSPCWCCPSTARPPSWCRASRRHASWSDPRCSRSARGTRPTTRSRSSPTWSGR